MKIAIVGSGISGLVSAFLLSEEHEVVVYEAADYIGGHTHTLPVEVNGERSAIDTGFIVFNPENYPNFTRLMKLLGVESQPSNMSFSVRDDDSGLEYNGTSLNGLFAQRENLFDSRFRGMVKGIIKFYREAPALLEAVGRDKTLGEFVAEGGYSNEFLQWHLYPMGSAIWSTGASGIQQFPASSFVEFFRNHGFFKLVGRPRWRVLKGGSDSYVVPLTKRFRRQVRLCTPVVGVQRRPDQVLVRSGDGTVEDFDVVVFANHSDQAVSILEDPSPLETEILGSIRYASNETVLHTDESMLPRLRRARAGWNYHLPMHPENKPCVTYYMNLLQGLHCRTNFGVTLNRTERIDPSRILARMVYHHPVYDFGALRAQSRRKEINGHNRTFYCGAYWGYGFHEDGVRSALDVGAFFGKGF